MASLPGSGRPKPMMIDLENQRVCLRPLVVRPQLALLEPHAVERDALAADPPVGAVFRVLEAAAAMIDHADLAPHVDRRSHMPGLAEIDDPHAIAQCVAWRSI